MAGEDSPSVAEYRRPRAVPRLREKARAFFRLSPDRPCFAVRRGDVHKRLDYHFHRPELVLKVRALERCRYEVAPLSQLIGPDGEIQNFGAYSLCNFIRFVNDGIPFVKVENYSEDGIRWNDCPRITPDVHDLLWKSKLQQGDVLLSMAGSIGVSTIVRDKCEANSNQAIAKIRLRTQRVTEDFLSCFFNSDVGRKQSLRVSNGGVQLNINLGEIGTLLVPTPPPDVQKRLVAALDAARAARRRKLEEAESLLGGLDAFVLEALGLTLPPPDGNRTTYAVRLADLREGRKLYPDYFHPERLNAIRAVERKYKGDRCATLLSVADFRRDQRKIQPGDPYLGLANIQPNTGERIDSTEEDGEGTVFEYAQNDVLFARMRPYLNKVYQAESGGVCSPEFHVMRVHPGPDGKPRVIPDYLAAVLRSALVLSQTRHMMTGNTHPRLANDDVVNLVIPVPDFATQKKIAAEVSRRRAAARRLREDAAQLWDDAKHRFEEELLGPVVGEAPKRRRR